MHDANPSSADFFEAKYRDAPNNDPWDFARAAYELQRYDTVISALEGRRYAHAFEPGCSVGVLTERLAAICDSVEACDFSSTAASVAQVRCSSLSNVIVRCAALDEKALWQKYDLIVLCEIGYYFNSNEWLRLVQTMTLQMRPGSILIASHWLGVSQDHVQTGDAVHAAITHPLLRCTLEERKEGFRLQRWTRTT